MTHQKIQNSQRVRSKKQTLRQNDTNDPIRRIYIVDLPTVSWVHTHSMFGNIVYLDCVTFVCGNIVLWGYTDQAIHSGVGIWVLIYDASTKPYDNIIFIYGF